VDNPTPNVGDVVLFTVTLTNVGPKTATDVAVNDLLPPGLAFVSATPSQGTYNSATGDWELGTVPIVTPETLTIQARVVSPGAQTNTATVGHSDQFDPNPTNNQATAVVTPQQADLQVSKSVDNPTPLLGELIHYTIVLTDNGPEPATRVTVNDLLPADVSFVSESASVGAYDPTTGVWTVGTVNVGAPQTLTITAEVMTPDPGTNTGGVGHTDVFDPNPNDNSASASITPQEADLALSKTVDNATPTVGDTVAYTLTVTDDGPSDATNVQVTDLLPAGQTFVNDSPSEGSYNPATGVWTVGTVTITTPQTLTIVARVVSPSTLTNTANITHSDQFEPDPSNNRGSATVKPQQAILSPTKTVTPPSPLSSPPPGPPASEPPPATPAPLLPPSIGFTSQLASSVVRLFPVGASEATNEATLTLPVSAVFSESLLTPGILNAGVLLDSGGDEGEPQTVITGTVFADLNADGVREQSKPGLPGRTVVLELAGKGPVRTTVTDATGNFVFGGLTPGSYRV
jgi:uncharacterized repeat protein (TIGR01451 family)